MDKNKKNMKKNTMLGTIALVVFACGLILIGYRVIVTSGEKPGKLVSLSTAADNLYYSGVSMAEVKKVDYDIMKYGYMDKLKLAQMEKMDAYYDNERMEEVRKVNDLTAMSEWSDNLLAYEEFKANQEKEAKEAIEKAEKAQAAADAARKAKVASILESIRPSAEVQGNFIFTGDSSDLGVGDTASRGGAIGEKVMADTHGDSLGTFVITAYCTCRVCCGVYSGGNRTASGTVPTSNRTVAVDTSLIPFGTKLVINGQVYVAEDRGSAIIGKHIDMFFYTHKEATLWGKRNMEVFYYH